MARLPRLRIPELPLHVVVRGNDRQAIFRTEGDRIYFHRTLVEASRKHGMLVHAYVFMPNHIHLLATGGAAASIGAAIQALGRRYVRYFNFLHHRTGGLWEGRFHSSVVDTDRYFMTCQRYIELNPVRAGLCTTPMHYQWSSHRRYAAGIGDDLVTPHSIHSQWPSDSYCRIFEEPMSASTVASIREALKRGQALGDDAFRKQISVLSGIPVKRPRPGKPPRS